MHISVSVEEPKQLQALLGMSGIERYYLPIERYDAGSLQKEIEACRSAGAEVYLALPPNWNWQEVLPELTASAGAADGFLIRNIDQAAWLREREMPGKRVFDQGLYTWNTDAAKVWKELGADLLTAPYELNGKELKTLLAAVCLPMEIMIYGYCPVMISSQCLRLTTGGCVKKSKPYTVFGMTDRTGQEFRAVNHCRGCYNIIYNTVPTWIGLPDVTDRYRLSFTVEEPDRVRGIAEKVLSGFAPEGAYTRGHYRRGAE